MILKLSEHAKKKHADEKWNAVTIKAAYLDGRMKRYELLEGKTADVLFGEVDGEIVGFILSKPKFGIHVIITGFAAPAEYWKTV